MSDGDHERDEQRVPKLVSVCKSKEEWAIYRWTKNSQGVPDGYYEGDEQTASKPLGWRWTSVQPCSAADLQWDLVWGEGCCQSWAPQDVGKRKSDNWHLILVHLKGDFFFRPPFKQGPNYQQIKSIYVDPITRKEEKTLRMTTLNGFNEAFNVLLKWLGYTLIFSLHWPGTYPDNIHVIAFGSVDSICKSRSRMIEYSVVSAIAFGLFGSLLKLVRCRY